METTNIINTAAIIDDDEVHLMLYERVIKRSGLIRNLLKFPSAEEALNHLESKQTGRIEIIFLDINMPRMNGFEFLQAATASLGNDFTNGVVIMLTTSLDPGDKLRAEEFEVVKKFLNKPLTVEAIEDVVGLI